MKDKSIKINALLNIIKQCCAIVFPLITFPYISRILGPENYGKYNYGNSIVSYFSLFAGLGISTYAIREGARIRDNKTKIKEFASQIFTINIITTLIAYVALAILLLFSESLSEYVGLIVIQSIIILCTTIGADWLNSIYEDYFYITLRYILMQIISLVLLFILVKKSSDYILYAFIVVIACAGANIVNYFHVYKRVKFGLTTQPRLGVHLKPMLLLFCNSLAVTIYVNSDITMLGYIRGDIEVGIYGIATKIYQIIKQLLNSVVGVMLPRMSAYLSKGEKVQYMQLLKKSFSVLTILLLPTVTGVFMLAKPIILLIGGKEYLDGALALRILCVALGCAVYGAFFANCVLLPNRMDKKYLTATVIAAVLNVLLNLVFIPRFGLYGAALTTVVAEAIVCFMTAFWSRYKIELKEVTKTFWQTVLGCCSIVIMCNAVCIFTSHYVIQVIFSIIASVIVYGMVLLLLKNEFAIQMVQNLKAKLK